MMSRPNWIDSRNDLLRLCGWVGLSLILLTASFLMDQPVAHLLTVEPSGFWRHFAGYCSKAGEGWVVATIGVMGAVFFFLNQRYQASRDVLLVSITGLLTGAAATIIRSLLGRTRPSSHEIQGFYGIWHDSHWIIGRYEFGSFPSGHAATAIGLAAAAWLLDRRLGLLATLYALLVSWSRLALGCHHFSDEVAAALLAIYGAHVVLRRLRPKVFYVVEQLRLARRPAQPACPLG